MPIKNIICNLIILTMLQTPISTVFTKAASIHKPSPFYDYNIGLSPDGTILAKADSNNSIIIQQKIGLTYTFLQQIIATNSISSIFIDSTNQFMTLVDQNRITIYKKNQLIFTFFQEIVQTDVMLCIMSEDLKNLVFLRKLSTQIYNYVYDGVQYQFAQILVEAAGNLRDLKVTQNGSFLLAGGDEQILRIYQRDTKFQYNFIKQFSTVQPILQIVALEDLSKIILAGGLNTYIYLYQLNILQEYYLFNSYLIWQSPVQKLMASKDWSIVIHMAIDFCHLNIFTYTGQGLLYLQTYQQPLLLGFQACSLNSYGMELICSKSYQTAYLSQCYIQNCTICLTSTVCSACQINYMLVNFTCEYTPPPTPLPPSPLLPPPVSPPSPSPSPSPPMQNTAPQNSLKYCLDSIDLQYCSQFCEINCLACLQSSNNCVSCMQMFTLDSNNNCILTQQSWSIIGLLYAIASFLRVRNTKSLFFILDDIWLYQYQKVQYIKIPKQIFITIHLIESMKDQILNIDMSPFIDNVKSILISYLKYTNQKYIQLQRSDDSLLNNQIDYLFRSVPIGIALFLLLKIVFFVLFNRRISRYLRVMSFNWFLVVMLLEGEIQRISFLVFRNFTRLFAQSFWYKMNSIIVVGVIFFVVVYCSAAYLLFKIHYRKLVKYFMDNLKVRVVTCFLMNLLYGLRPLAKGAIHSLLYQDTQTQLTLLTVIDFSILVVLASVELNRNIFESKMSLGCLLSYLYTSIPLNILLFWNYTHRQNQQIMETIDNMIYIVVILRILYPILSVVVGLGVNFNLRSEGSKDDKNQQGQKHQEQVQVSKSQEFDAKTTNKNNKKPKIIYHVIFVERKDSKS